MNTVSRAFAKKATSGVTAFILACTMCPAAALAYADEAAGAPETAGAVDAADEAGSQATDAANADTAKTVPAAEASAIPATDAADEASQPKNIRIEEIADEPVKVVSGNVALAAQDEALSTLVNVDGLNFAIDTAAGEAAFVGWTTTPAGNVAIPNTVQNGDDLLPVTEMSLGGGGSVISPLA